LLAEKAQSKKEIKGAAGIRIYQDIDGSTTLKFTNKHWQQRRTSGRSITKGAWILITICLSARKQ